MAIRDVDVEEVLDTPRLEWDPDVVIEALGRVVTPARRARIERVVGQRLYGVTVVLEELVDPHNASAILRSADAFGVQRVHVVPGERGFFAARAVSKGTHRWLDILRHRSIGACAEHLQRNGYRVLVASMDGTHTPEELATMPRVAVVFGNEHRGVTPEARGQADGTYRIPMRGFAESLNVSVAAAITLHHGTLGRKPDLSERARRELVARFLLDDVRDAERIVRDYEARGG